MNEYPVPLKEIRREIIVINSRFIACLAPAFTVDESKQFILRIKQEYPDASHHVSAYLIGHSASEIAHCTDAGEPSGTAGKPMLTVLRGSGLRDVVVVVVRYFGGTKLGTGGLVRAYSDAVREVTILVPRAKKVPAVISMVAIPYSLYENFKRLIARYEGVILDQDFLADITLTVRISTSKYLAFVQDIEELTNGSISPIQISEVTYLEAIVTVNQ